MKPPIQYARTVDGVRIAYTVARHVSSIFAKTVAANRTEAARFAREGG
jgi:hypothetical protein